MPRFGPWCVLLAFLLPGCAPMRPAEGTALPGGAAGAVPAPAAAPDAAREEFEARVLPILRQRCSPCHFEGGRMYERLPFDRPGTIVVLGTALFTRIRDEEERRAIRQFLGLGAGAPADEDAPEGVESPVGEGAPEGAESPPDGGPPGAVSGTERRAPSRRSR